LGILYSGRVRERQNDRPAKPGTAIEALDSSEKRGTAATSVTNHTVRPVGIALLEAQTSPLLKEVPSDRKRRIELQDLSKIPAITSTSLKLFLAFAEDAPNWSGTPLVGGNVGGSKEDRGNLTQLKRAGLIRTNEDEGNVWVSFTLAGRALAIEHGLAIWPDENR
jgi:hypothetical protein